MVHFLLVYERSRGVLRRMERFEEADNLAALDARFAEEALHAADDDVEVVVISGESFEAIRQSHSRYFMTAREILASY